MKKWLKNVENDIKKQKKCKIILEYSASKKHETNV